MTARRRGGVPPIVTVLITISAVVAASLVAWFMWTTTRSATSQPIIEVTDGYTDGSTVVFTLRNIGNTQVSVGSVTVSCKGYTASSVTCSGSVPGSVPAGGSLSCKATGFSVAISDGDSCVAQIPGGASVGFKVVKP